MADRLAGERCPRCFTKVAYIDAHVCQKQPTASRPIVKRERAPRPCMTYAERRAKDTERMRRWRQRHPKVDTRRRVDDERVAQLRAAGWKITDIAAEVGFTGRTVLNALRRAS